jgi:hypothetical protein
MHLLGRDAEQLGKLRQRHAEEQTPRPNALTDVIVYGIACGGPRRTHKAPRQSIG